MERRRPYRESAADAKSPEGPAKARRRFPPASGHLHQGGNAMAVPFDQRSDLIWLDGKLIPTADCKISVLTHGLHYASCVFEGERAYGGVVFRGTEHTERLKRSAELMDFEIPYTIAEIDAA